MPRRLLLLPFLAVALPLAAMRCTGPAADRPVAAGPTAEGTTAAALLPSGPVGASVSAADPDTALFAGGCFWCMEPPFERLDGVLSVTSGFAGGRVADPSYEEVSRGGTGHAEAVLIVYDPGRITYEALLDVFWHNVDPFSAEGQFCDRGNQYRSALFVLDPEQRRLAEASKADVQTRFAAPVATEVNAAAPFYPAEDYHQDFYKKDPDRYYSYREGCGRDARLRALWGDAADASH